MDDDIRVLRRIYDCFNARDIDGVLAALAGEVAWANAMEGGYAHGHAAVRDYWTRQWAVVSPHVEPLGFRRGAGGAIVVEVRQSVRGLDGQPLQGQSGMLTDKIVDHVFHLSNGKVVRFDVADTAGDS